MTTAERIETYIKEQLAKVSMDETERDMVLDDAVYNTPENDVDPSEINNQGLHGQAEYLLGAGWTENEIKSAADEYIKENKIS